MKTKLLIFFKNIDGGTGTYLEALLEVKKLFTKDELEIKVLVLDTPLYRSRYIKGCIFFPKNNSHSNKYGVRNVIRFANELRWFRKETNKFKPDVVISEDLHSIFITETTKSLSRVNYRTVGIIYNNIRKVIEYKVSKYLYWPIKLAVSICLNKSFLIVTVSRKLSTDIFNSFNLNKMPLTIGTALREDFNKKKNSSIKIKNTIICVARLDNQKDHKTLLNAFKIVLNKIPDAKLWIVGDGPLRTELELECIKLGINSEVKFWGWIQNITEMLDKSDVFVLPTKWEGFGLVILEAMFRGVPVVVSDCNFGPSEILGKNKYGMLTPVGDVHRLAESLIKLLSDRKMHTHYSLIGYKRSKEFTQKIVLPEYKRIILSANSGKYF